MASSIPILGAAGRCLAADPSGGAGSLSPGTTSLLSAIIKVSGSLLVVVGIMLVLLYAIKRTGLGSGLGNGSSAITVLETRMVAPKKYIAIVDVAGRCLALGITDHNITLLSDLGTEAKSALTSKPIAAGPGFAGLLKRSLRAQQTASNDTGGKNTPPMKQDSP